MRKFNRSSFLFLVLFLYMFVYLLVLPENIILRTLSIIGVALYALIIYGEMKKLKVKEVNKWNLLSDVRYVRKKWKKAR